MNGIHLRLYTSENRKHHGLPVTNGCWPRPGSSAFPGLGFKAKASSIRLSFAAKPSLGDMHASGIPFVRCPRIRAHYFFMMRRVSSCSINLRRSAAVRSDQRSRSLANCSSSANR